MNVVKLLPAQVTPNEFVAFWKTFYTAYNDAIYFEVINKAVLEEPDVYNLFRWKNNMSEGLSRSKKTFINRGLVQPYGPILPVA